MNTPTTKELAALLRAGQELARVQRAAIHDKESHAFTVAHTLYEDFRAAADALEAAPPTPAECSTLDHRWISNLPHATCLCGEFRRAAPATPAPAPELGRIVRHDLALRLCVMLDHDDKPLNEPCEACKAEALSFAMRIAASVALHHLHDAAPPAPPAAPTWEQRVERAAQAVANEYGANVRDGFDHEECERDAETAIRAAFPEYAPQEAAHV